MQRSISSGKQGMLMVKKLRRNFVLINMSLVSLLLAVVFGAQIVSNYRQVKGTSSSALAMALMWNEEGPNRWEMGAVKTPDERPELKPDQVRSDRPQDDLWTIIPTVCVTLDESGAVSTVVDNNVDISEEVLNNAVTAALSQHLSEGIVRELNLRYRVDRSEDNTRIAFADRTWEKTTQREQMLSSGLIFVAAMLGFLAVSIFLSKWALRPVEKSWKQQQQFVADASHELKTPLTVMLADTNILLSHRTETIDSQIKWVQYIQDEAQRMKILVEDMLFLTRSDDAQTRDEVFTDVALSDLAWSCLLPFEPVAFENGVALEGDVAPDLTIQGDREKLRRLMVILLDNACKYAGQGGSVTLCLTKNGEKILLSVHNTGEPIPPEAQEHLFERFYRADAARDREKGGFGLGLSIAHSIAAGHGGTISVASAAGEGTTFTVVLPER